ncbi:amidase [Actinosynnema sp. NPDC002837]
MPELPLTLTDAAAALRSGEVTSLELTEAAIAAAERADDALGVFLSRFDDEARRAARRADDELAAGTDRGPLHGIPMGIKDIMPTVEGPTTSQSLVFDRDWGDGHEGPVIARLRAAGAVISGKTTTMEFALGLPDQDKPFPLPRNPWDLSTWAGGSSSGSASGVAAGMFYAGMGTDTAGGIRMAAAFNGVSGLMPTFGRVPKSGCLPLGYSLDHIGMIGRSARDCAVVLAAVAGRDESDPDSVDAPFAVPEQLDHDLSGLRIGVVRDGHFPDHGDPATATAFEAALARFEEAGAELVEVSLPYRAEVMTVHQITMTSEGLAYHRPDLHKRWDDYFAATRWMLAQGALVSGADYVQAQRVRRVAQHAVAELFGTVDLVVCPTASMGAPSYADLSGDITALGALIHTGYWDCIGNPVLAVPMGFTASGLPLSLQIAAPAFGEATAVRAGEAFQAITDWHLRVPGLDPGTEVEPPAPGAMPAADPAELAAVRVLFSGATLAPAEGELQAFALGYPDVRTAVAALYAVPEARYADPALRFVAGGRIVDWRR